MGSSQTGAQLLLLAVLLVAFLLLVVRPARNRLKAVREVQAGLRVGSEVMTSAGLLGVVHAIEQDLVVLEVAPGVHLRFATGAVVRILDTPPTGPTTTGPA